MIDIQSIEDRFTRYVQIDTESDPFSETFPSTMKQKDLAKVLVSELQALGIEDAWMDEHGYVFGTVPATVPAADLPVICFCAHMDTSPDASGKDVKPIITRRYDGSPIVLPDDPNQILTIEKHPKLASQIGNDVVTASGTTLLGADNKSGVTAIMCAVEALMKDRTIPCPTLRILFTPDEEVGRGVEKLDMDRLGADYGYTIDGEERGALEDETFSADALSIHITGVSAHPGYALNILENAVKIAGDIVSALPKERLSPETTEGRMGFVHPLHIEGKAEGARIDFIIRDFRTELLDEHVAEVQRVADTVIKNYPGSSIRLERKEQYRNMKEILDHHPQVVSHAEEAMQRAGIEVKKRIVRGGTDGSQLSFMGLPCPNVFAGEHAFHSRQEWVSLQDMVKSSETIVHLAQVWAER